MRRFALLAAMLVTGPDTIAADEAVSFGRDVAPLLVENCLACHGPKKAEGGYRLDSFDELRKPGDSGETPVVAGGGELLRRLTSADPAERMPADSEPLSAEQLDLVRRWVEAGAGFDGDRSDDPLFLAMPPRRYPDPPSSYLRPVPVAAMAFSPDGRQLLVGGYHEIAVWNVENGSLVRRITDMPQRLYALTFLPDGHRLAAAGGEPGRSGEVRLIEFDSGSVIDTLARSPDVALDVAVRTKTGELAVASADGLIRIVNPGAPNAPRTIAGHADWVFAVAWSDDGALLASASRDKSAKIYASDTGELLANYQGHGAAVRGVAFAPDGKQVFSTGADGRLHRWAAETGGKIAEVGFGGDAFHIVRGPDFIIVPCADRQVRRVDLANNAVAKVFGGHEDWVLSAAISADGARVASGGLDGTVRLWNSADGSVVRSWTAKP